MASGFVIAMLAVETVSDIRKKKVSVIRILMFLAAGIVLNIMGYGQSVGSMLGGVAVGAAMFVYSLLTHESIGYGDCLIFACAGLYIGFSQNIRLLFFSLAVAGISGGIYALVKKKKLKTKIPFVPYILGTYIAMTGLELIGGTYAVKW